jgi:putative ABC transport system permease protein
MWWLVFGVLRGRPGQTALLFLLAGLAIAAGTAAPMYAAVAGQDARLHELATASSADRSVSVRVTSPGGGTADPAEDLRYKLRGAYAGTGLRDVTGLALSGRATRSDPPDAGGAWVNLVAREDVCAHLVLTGRCPQAGGEAVLGAAAARALGLSGSDEFQVLPTGVDKPLRLRVVGTYRPVNADEPYWAGRADVTNDPNRVDVPVFVAATTVATAQVPQVQASLDLIAPDEVALRADPASLDAAVGAVRRLAPPAAQVTSNLPVLVGRIDDGQTALTHGVTIGAGQLIGICGFVLLLAVGYAAVDRRAESGLAAVRGAPRRHRLALALGPSLLVLLAAAPVGFFAGWLAVTVVARLSLDGRVPVRVTSATFAVAGGSLLVVLAATMVAEWRAHSGSPLQMLRGTPPRRRGWRVDLADLVVVALAVAAAYQLITGVTVSGFATLAPGLIALACGLAAGRLVLPAAVGIGAARLRQGGLAAGLAALHLARRPQAHRLLALIAVAVALGGQAVAGLDTTTRAVRDRARLELGADRVLSVSPKALPAGGSGGSRAQALDPTTVVLAAVHAADPQGRWAMAATRQELGADTIVAVEADRLGAVADWPDGGGVPPAAQVSGALRPPTGAPIMVTGTELRLDVEVTGALGVPTPVTVRLIGADGSTQDAQFLVDPRLGRRTYSAPAPGCAGEGCRLAWFGFASSPEGLRLHELSQTGPERIVADAAGLAAPGRWRPGFTTGPQEMTVLQGNGWLTARYRPTDPRTLVSDLRVMAVDAPAPLPVIAAGSPDLPQTDDVRSLPALSTGNRPVEVIAAAAGLPGAGAHGYLVDLEYADRLSGDPDPATVTQVWLAAGTPSAVVNRLRERLQINSEQTVAGRAGELLRQGPGQAVRVQLLAALLGLALAALAIAVIAAVERGRRAAELRALRVQGLPATTAARSGLLGYSWLVLGGVVAGLVAASVSWWATREVLPAFVDGWTATGVPATPRLVVAVPALIVVTAVLLGAAGLAARKLAAAVHADLVVRGDAPASEPVIAGSSSGGGGPT